MSYKCFGCLCVKQSPDIVKVYSDTVSSDTECQYRGVCSTCDTIPQDQWAAQPSEFAIVRNVRPAPTIEEQAYALVGQYIDIVRLPEGNFKVRYYSDPNDVNSTILDQTFDAI